MKREKKNIKGFRGSRRRKSWGTAVLAWVLIFTLAVPAGSPAFVFGEETVKEETRAAALENREDESGGNSGQGQDKEMPETTKADQGTAPETAEASKEEIESRPETGGNQQESREEEDEKETGSQPETETDSKSETEKDGSFADQGTETESSAAETKPDKDKEEAEGGKGESDQDHKTETKPEIKPETQTPAAGGSAGENGGASEEKESDTENLRDDEVREDGLCMHHWEHTQECGYEPGGEVFCTHVHDDTCNYQGDEEKTAGSVIGGSKEQPESKESGESDGTSESNGAGKADETLESKESEKADEALESNGSGKADGASESKESGKTDGATETKESGKVDGAAETKESGKADGAAETKESGKTDGALEGNSSGKADNTSGMKEAKKADEVSAAKESEEAGESVQADRTPKAKMFVKAEKLAESGQEQEEKTDKPKESAAAENPESQEESGETDESKKDENAASKVSNKKTAAKLPCGHVHDDTCGYDPTLKGSPCRFRCPLCITEWKWVEKDDEELLIWSEDTKQWGLGLPGASEDMPVTRDVLEEMLPTAVLVKTAAGEKRVKVTWNFDDFPEEGVYEGIYRLNAILARTSQGEQYVLTRTAGDVEVVLDLGGGEMYALSAIAINEWEWEGYGKQGDEVVVAVSIDGISTAAQLAERLEPLLPKRIYGSSSGDKSGAAVEGYTFVKSNEGKTKSWGYLKIDWTGQDKNRLPVNPGDGKDPPTTGSPDSLRVQIEKEFGSGSNISFDKEFSVYAGKPVAANTRYYISNIWDLNGTNNIFELPITIKPISLTPHIVPSANPGNVTVNLFDYWVEGYGENPSSDTTINPRGGDILLKGDWHFHEGSTTATGYSCEDDWGKGINKNHLLLFGDGLIHGGLWNKGAGENTNYGKQYAGMEKIVKNVLENEYPVINTDLANDILIGDNSRDYKLIKDYRLAGDHIGDRITNGNSGSGKPYESDKIKNLSDTVIRNWGGTIGVDTESLEYLFNPGVSHANKKNYTDVKGLFQLDKDGYYYYKMRENFAEFVEENDNNHFILYDAPATTRTDGDNSIGNFFPFNKGVQVFNGLEAGKLTSNISCSGNEMNHHLGMTVDVAFRQPVGGMISAGKPMTFEFAGDDDVWIFIDDVLVLDLGGVHSELYGTIDFSTGDVYIGRAFKSKGIPENPAGDDMVTKTNLKALYEAASRAGKSSDWNGNTFASNTSHELKMFYLERGNYDSSIALRFNLQAMLPQKIKKVDQNGKPIADVKFDLYPAVKTDDKTQGIQCLYTDTSVGGGNVFYVKQEENATPLVSVTTDKDGIGEFRVYGTGADTSQYSYFNFADRGDQYYLLKETKPAVGYRNQPEDIVLHYDPTTSMLSVANRWTTGAYACSVGNATGPRSDFLYYGVLDQTEEKIVTGTGQANEVAKVDQEKGLVVTIPMLNKKSTGDWMALYGSNASGFGSVEVENRKDEESWKRALLLAALKHTADEPVPGDPAGVSQMRNYARWHLEWDDGNSRLYGMVDDLPGLANRYQLNNDAGDMRIVYGIISFDTLKALGIYDKAVEIETQKPGGIERTSAEARYEALEAYIKANGAETVCKTILGRPNGFRLINVDQFARNFRSLIYIPNERRELRVQKIDQDGKPLRGAEFGLYGDKACTQLLTSGKTDQEGMLVFSPSAADGVEGQAKMAWADNKDKSQYFLREITPPAGHHLNNTVIPIEVGIYSIYADAGTKDDGVSVMASVGRLTQVMRQYAIGGDVDITLQDIAAVMQTQNQPFAVDGWQDAKLEGTNIVRSMNLHFGKNIDKVKGHVDYGLHDEDGGKVFKPFFITDTGFVRTRVQQNYGALTNGQYEGAQTDVNKDDLKDTDLTNLFSLLNVVVVTDRTTADTNTGQLTISKKLAGGDLTEADYTKNFTFTVELRDGNNRPLAGEYHYYFYGEDKAGDISSGDKLVLHHDEAVTILGLPVGTRFTVTEEPEDGWKTDPRSKKYSGTITKDHAFEADFVNSKGNDTDNPRPGGGSGGGGSSGGGSGNKTVQPAVTPGPVVTNDPGGPVGTGHTSSHGLPPTGDTSNPGWDALLWGLLLLGLAVCNVDELRRKRSYR